MRKQRARNHADTIDGGGCPLTPNPTSKMRAGSRLQLMRAQTFVLIASVLYSACAQETPMDPIVQPPVEISPAAFVSTFTVTNVNDAGPGSFRQALLDANGSPGNDLIQFAIPASGPHTIQPQSALPVISDPVTIDGYTQPGASPNTNGSRDGTNAVLKIVLNGDAAGAQLIVDAVGTVIRGLVINGLGGPTGVHLRLGGGAVVGGCFFGTDPTGTIRHATWGRVISTGSSNNMIGGPTQADRNLVSGIEGEPVFIHGSGNVVQNNIIGLDATGKVVLGNLGGVWIKNPGQHVVGGPSFDLGNVITGNEGAGITVNLADDVIISGNLIGTDVTGTTPLSNQRRGVQVLNASNVRVGDPNGIGNVIASNNEAGVLSGGIVSGLSINNNLIGLDITGQKLLSPSLTNLGVNIGAGMDNLIRGNTIAGTTSATILLGSATASVIIGNRLGINLTGDALLGSQSGINVASPGNRIGGSSPGEGNVIGGSSGLAILVQTSNNVIQGNAVGTDKTGTIALPNGGGINIGGDSNLVGGSEPGAANIIALNAGGGIAVGGLATGNRISRNSIHSNGGKGIGHAPGGNNNQAFPILMTATTGGGVVTIEGTLTTAPSSTYTLEFFSNAAPDPSGFGEGETFLGAIDVTTDANGDAEFRASLSADVPAGHYAASTATGADGSTSEFSAVLVFANNAPPISDPNGPYAGDEGTAISFDGTGSTDPDSDPINYDWEFGDGNTGSGPAPSHTYVEDGSYTVQLTVTDEKNAQNSGSTTAEIANVAPTVDPVTAPLDPVAAGTSVTVSAGFTDPGILDTHTAEVDWGDGTSSGAAVSEANGSGTVQASHTYAEAGVYTVTVRVLDDDGGQGESVFKFVVVYDASAGFVTGAGWIDSPLGAYAADPNLTGKAMFGFVSEYKNGASVPTGNTRFQFRAGDLNFRSTSYEWLVISGARAKFKGSGTINDTGDYGFMLTGVDGQVSGGGGVDRFRIKIWEKGTEIVIYDNEMGTPDDAADATGLGAGSISITDNK